MDSETDGVTPFWWLVALGATELNPIYPVPGTTCFIILL